MGPWHVPKLRKIGYCHDGYLGSVGKGSGPEALEEFVADPVPEAGEHGFSTGRSEDEVGFDLFCVIPCGLGEILFGAGEAFDGEAGIFPEEAITFMEIASGFHGIDAVLAAAGRYQVNGGIRCSSQVGGEEQLTHRQVISYGKNDVLQAGDGGMIEYG